MLDDVKKRLESFGYIVTDLDAWVLDFIIQKVENHIKNQCNTSIVPEGLKQTEIEMIVGEFLFSKKSMGQLIGFDFDAVVKSIQEGDTNVTFAIGSGSTTPESRFDALLGFLMHGDTDFASYRCIKW